MAGTSSGPAVTINLNAIVESEPCVINNNDTIVVDFGDDLMTTKIDGNNYQQTIKYTLDCSNASNASLKMMISGTGALFDTTVLKTDQSNLGIQLLSNGQKIPLNNWFDFSSNTSPTLIAVPVKKAETSLTAGVFSSTATMLVDYQ